MPTSETGAIPTRELAAIMFSDIAGYTAIMSRDEARAMAALDHHRTLLQSLLPKFHGRLIGEIGDGTLSSFHSALDAVNCAREVQAALEGKHEFQVRIGIHVGDVLFSNNDVHGDGVNVASRIHALTAPGGICISERVYEDIRNKPEMRATDLGLRRLKNVTGPVRVYALAATAAAELPRPEMTPWRARALAAGMVTLLVAGLGYGIMQWKAPAATSRAAAGPRVIRSIAVMPLDNFSGDPNQEYFSDGLTDELTTNLATISELRVISRGSVMQYKGAHRPPTPQIARALNVDAVVEGSVVRAGDKVRVTAQLIDAPADKHLWAGTYERDSKDVLAMQDEIAQAIAREINVQLTPNERAHLVDAHPVDPAAHEAYLRGRYYLSGWSPENLTRAIAQFNRAIKLDPNFALPYAGLADAYSTASDLYTSPSVMPQARAAAEKALQLDDSLAEAQAALAGVNFLFDYDYAAAETRYRRAIELGPSYAAAHSWYGFLLCMEGRFDEAIAQGKQATELDPLSSAIAVYASLPYTFQGKFDVARAMVQQGLELGPTSDFAQLEMGTVYLESGDYPRAIVELEKARRPDAVPYVAGWLGYAYAASGDRARAQALVKELEATSSQHYVSPFSIAMIYLALGDKERALAGLENTYEVHSQWLFLLKVDKIFDPLRAEPRFIALMKKVGFDK